MSDSLEVRQFLMRHDETMTSSATGVPTQRSSGADAVRISDDQVRRARLAVAGRARDAQDCASLLDMLGLASGADGVPPVQR